MSTSLFLDGPTRESLESHIRAGRYEIALRDIYQILEYARWEESFELWYNQLPELDQLVQTIGREILAKKRPPKARQPGKVNVFIATEVYPAGGHTRVIEDLVRLSDKESVIVLTDIFEKYANGYLEPGRVATQLNAPIWVLPKMSLVDKTKSLIGLIDAIDVNTVAIFAHHEDVIAYAACNENLGCRQAFFHHADHNPALGATIAHYEHVDLVPGNLQMCIDAGYVTPSYMPLYVVEKFRNLPSSDVFNTGTSGTFNKFVTEGPLNFADIVVTILQSISGQHVHVGEIPEVYLNVIADQLRHAGIDPSRFVYLGYVSSLQQALIDQNVSVYITSAPIGGSKAYVEVLGLGIGVLMYAAEAVDVPSIVRYNNGASYAKSHLRWSNVEELSGCLTSMSLDKEFGKSRAFLA